MILSHSLLQRILDSFMCQNPISMYAKIYGRSATIHTQPNDTGALQVARGAIVQSSLLARPSSCKQGPGRHVHD